MDTNNWIEKEIKKQLKDQHGIVEEELDRNSLTIIELCADLIQAKFDEMRILQDENMNLRIDNQNKKIEIEDLQDTLDEIKNLNWEKDLY